MSSSEVFDAMRPGGFLVVESAGFEAAVQDADEPVGELAEGGVVVGAAGSLLVVVGAGGGGWPGQAGEEPGGELAEGGVVVGAAGSLLVVVGAGAGRCPERGEGLGHESVDEP